MAENRGWLWEWGAGRRREPPDAGYGTAERVHAVVQEWTREAYPQQPARNTKPMPKAREIDVKRTFRRR